MNDRDDPRQTHPPERPTGSADSASIHHSPPTLTYHAQPPPASETVPAVEAHAPPVPSSANTRIPGYDVLEEVGRGGMGVVYKARQVAVNRIVALKTLLTPSGIGSSALVRFQIEAEAIATLQHPSIVQLFEFGTVEGIHYLTLEYVPGGTLAERIKQKPLTPHQAAALVAKLAIAVQAAHQRGILHRDLKPGNVLLTEAGEPKITDFGLARIGGSDLTLPGAVLGTPLYTSPEQAVGESHKVGALATLFAAGLTVGVLVPRYKPAQAIPRTGVWVERDANAEAMFKISGQNAKVYKYSGGTVDFWLELTVDWKKLTAYHPTSGRLRYTPEHRGVRPGQFVEGAFVWIRGERNEKGVMSAKRALEPILGASFPTSSDRPEP